MTRTNILDFFKKLDTETVNDYICRLGLYREKYNLCWNDLIEPIYREFGIELTKAAIRKRYYRSVSNYYTEENVEQKIQDKTELYRIQSEKQQLNNYYKVLSREETLKDIGIRSAKIIADKYPFDNFSTKYYENINSNKEGILLIGDWHYGITINADFVNRYNTDIAKNRVNELCQKTIEYIKFYKLRVVHVINLGDMICGLIHLPLRLQSQTDVITQVIEVSELIANLLNTLSNYASVEYYSTLDNHSRLDPNKKDSIQLETLARITPWFLNERFNKNPNVIIHTNYTYTPDIVSCNIKGFKILAVHGDKDKPEQVVDKLTSFTGKRHDLICTAHYHHFTCTEQNFTTVISNGSLMGTDEYAMDLRLSSNPSQTLVIVSPSNVCEHICKINLS